MPDAPTVLVDALLEFFEAAVYTTLRARNLYPSEVFHGRKLYGIAVHRARHPEVIHYVGTAFEQVKVPKQI
jgi:hypothetical protein